MLKQITRITQLLVAVLVVLLLAGMIYQQTTLAQASAKHPPPGQLISAGENRLHLHCLGEGSPTVIVDTGAADWSLSWLDLHPQLAQLTRTCIYDRAGLGWSEAGDAPRTSNQLAKELHTLLENANLEPPFILMGHSLGGYNARIYAEDYPDEVAGMIFLEAAHENQWEEFSPQIATFVEQQSSLLDTMSFLTHLGIVRLILPDKEHLAPDLQPIFRYHMAQSHHLSTSSQELGGGIESATQVPENTSLGDLPLVVVTAGRSFDAFRSMTDDLPFEESEAIWQRLQVDLTTLSSNSVHLISPEATHDIHLTDPTIVIEGVRQILQMTNG